MNYTFENPFELMNNGKKDKAQSCTVTSPTNEVLEDISLIEGEFMRAMFKMQKDNPNVKPDDAKENKVDEIDGKVAFLTLIAGGGDVVKCIQALKRIFQKTAKITTTDGSILQFKELLFDKIEYSETKNLLGEYIKSFLLSSLNV